LNYAEISYHEDHEFSRMSISMGKGMEGCFLTVPMEFVRPGTRKNP
jgi:hypothetical protein